MPGMPVATVACRAGVAFPRNACRERYSIGIHLPRESCGDAPPPAAVSPVGPGRSLTFHFTLSSLSILRFLSPLNPTKPNTSTVFSIASIVVLWSFGVLSQENLYDPPGDKCSELLALHSFRMEPEPSMTMCSLAACYGSLRKMR